MSLNPKRFEMTPGRNMERRYMPTHAALEREQREAPEKTAEFCKRRLKFMFARFIRELGKFGQKLFTEQSDRGPRLSTKNGVSILREIVKPPREFQQNDRVSVDGEQGEIASGRLVRTHRGWEWEHDVWIRNQSGRGLKNKGRVPASQITRFSKDSSTD